MSIDKKYQQSRSTMGKILFRIFILIVPFIASLIWYVSNDPFKVIRTYTDYDHAEIFENEGVMSWYKYKQNRNKAHYDSFIMGNSCTKAFRGEDWKKYIKGTPFRLFNNGVGLADLYDMLSALDRQKNQPIKNLFITLDKSVLKSSYPKNGFMHVMPPEVSKMSEMSFQMTFIHGFFCPGFTIPYIDYSIFHIYRNSTMQDIINPIGFTRYGMMNNAFNYKEIQIKDLKEKYWQTNKWKSIFDKHKTAVYEKCCIGKAQIHLLKSMEAICHRHHTNAKIVISPSLNSGKMNDKDIAIIKKIFGNGNVFDYSGTNEISNDYHNFYDDSHYRTEVGRRILKFIYGKGEDFK
jgi:hypothetical protein